MTVDVDWNVLTASVCKEAARSSKDDSFSEVTAALVAVGWSGGAFSYHSGDASSWILVAGFDCDGFEVSLECVFCEAAFCF